MEQLLENGKVRTMPLRNAAMIPRIGVACLSSPWEVGAKRAPQIADEMARRFERLGCEVLRAWGQSTNPIARLPSEGTLSSGTHRPWCSAWQAGSRITWRWTSPKSAIYRCCCGRCRAWKQELCAAFNS